MQNQPFKEILRSDYEFRYNHITDREEHDLLNACRKGDKKSQEKLYRHYYGYAMGISLRYSRNKEEAIEITNDGFLKMFLNLNKYSFGYSFKSWLRRIVINAAIDHYRRNEKHYHSLDISHAQMEHESETLLDNLSAKEIIDQVQKLPASYRTVFNLFVIEGYKHEEIASLLNISVGTSKSNLSIARSKLKKMLLSEGFITKSTGNHG